MVKFKPCFRCNKKLALNTNNIYNGQEYCAYCYNLLVAYDRDDLRKKHDIRNKDPKTLSLYQQSQLIKYAERLEEYKEKN